MFYMKGRFCARYCNNIEADRKVYFESFDICISRNDDISYFPVGDSFFRLAELFVSPGFYFNDNQFPVCAQAIAPAHITQGSTVT